jgi:hypothetical protein
MKTRLVRVCADAVAALVAARFPRTYDVAHASVGLPARATP